MNKSESIKELATALAAAQAEMPAAPMDGINPFLKSKFASLGSVIQTARPILAKHGLAVSQLAVSMGVEAVGVTTILMHVSGEHMESTISLPLGQEKGKSLAQVAGSIITYLRRYSLAALLNMYGDEDSDGEPRRKKAAMPKKKAPAPKQELDEAKKPRLSPTGVKEWDEFLALYDITTLQATNILGSGVQDWINANPGKALTNAIQEIIAVGGLSPGEDLPL